VRRQITLPFFLVIFIIVVVVIVLVYFRVGTVERWSQISTIFLVVFSFIVGLIVLFLLIVITFLISQLLRLLPPYARLTQEAIEKIQDQAIRGADISVKPVIQVKSFLAMIGALFSRKGSGS
jgi:predicted PurR-regulated permease PerM